MFLRCSLYTYLFYMVHPCLVLPLTSTNTTLVQFFSTFECIHFARVPGALHARESSHEKQCHPCTPFTQKNDAGRQKSALSKPPPVAHGPSAEKTCTTRHRLSAAEDLARSRSCPRSGKMYKSQGAGVGHRPTLAPDAVRAEDEILSLLAA